MRLQARPAESAIRRSCVTTTSRRQKFTLKCAYHAFNAAGGADDTPLFGALPELDSMAVAGVLTELEDRIGILIEDDEVDGDMLETFGSLADFVRRKAIVA